MSIWNNKSNAERRALGRKFALKSSLIGILTILSLNEKSPNVFIGVRRINNSYNFIKRFSNSVKSPILLSIAFISVSIFS